MMQRWNFRLYIPSVNTRSTSKRQRAKALYNYLSLLCNKYFHRHILHLELKGFLYFAHRPKSRNIRKHPRNTGILVGYSLRISTQQLGCCYGIDFWKVAVIFSVSLVTALCYLIFISLLLAVYKTSSFVYFNKQIVF